MTLGQTLQVIGALLELGGLGTVAWGISDTRRRFTKRPSIKDQSVDILKRTAKRATARFRRKPRQTVVGVGAATGRIRFRGGRVYPTAKMDQSHVTVEERLDQIRTMLNQHAEKLTALEQRIDQEADSRKEADEAAEQRRRTGEEDLRKLIADAAAGGLRLEAVGVLLFAAGVVFGVAGSLVR